MTSGTSTVDGRDDHLRALAFAFEQLGREVAGVTGDSTGVDAIVAMATTHVPGAEAASITVLRQGRFSTLAASAPWVRDADRVQDELQSGPCVDADVADRIYCPRAIADDSDRPQFGAAVSQRFGVESMLSYRLHLGDQRIVGCLNMYAKRPAAFGDDAVSVGLLVATYAAMTLQASLSTEEAAQTRDGLLSNREIGIAMGILMARNRITREQAFDLLRIASQDSNRKLRDVAGEVADTGFLEIRAGRQEGQQH